MSKVKGKTSSRIYFALSVLFFIGILVQVGLAGAAVFVDAFNWIRHTTVIHLFGLNLPVLMLIVAAIGRMPKWAYWQVFGLLVSVFLMYLTANMRGTIPFLAAMHPVVALVLFVLSSWMVLTAYKHIRKEV